MLKVIAFSDTHRTHEDLTIDYCSVLIFAGDHHCTTQLELARFLEWFSEQPSEYKIFIPGNHDIYCEKNPEDTRQLMSDYDIIYLCDSGAILEGKKFWGSPVTPEFNNWAFNRTPEQREKHWKRVPENLDVLITHGPPKYIMDETIMTNGPVGCPYLNTEVENKKPKHHVFGHIHSAAGQKRIGSTHFHNVSVLTDNYAPNYKDLQEFEI